METEREWKKQKWKDTAHEEDPGTRRWSKRLHRDNIGQSNDPTTLPGHRGQSANPSCKKPEVCVCISANFSLPSSTEARVTQLTLRVSKGIYCALSFGLLSRFLRHWFLSDVVQERRRRILSLYLSIYLSINVSLHLFSYAFISLFINSICTSWISLGRSAGEEEEETLSFYLSIYLFINVSRHLFIIRLFFYLLIYTCLGSL